MKDSRRTAPVLGQTTVESKNDPRPMGEVGGAPERSPQQSKTTETATRKRHPLEKARAKAAERREELKAAGLPTRLNPIEKAKLNPTSLRRAINAKCWDCEGGDADPHARWRIGNCDIEDCPLLPVRPYQNKEGTPEPKSLRSWGEL